MSNDTLKCARSGVLFLQAVLVGHRCPFWKSKTHGGCRNTDINISDAVAKASFFLLLSFFGSEVRNGILCFTKHLNGFSSAIHVTKIQQVFAQKTVDSKFPECSIYTEFQVYFMWNSHKCYRETHAGLFKHWHDAHSFFFLSFFLWKIRLICFRKLVLAKLWSQGHYKKCLVMLHSLLYQSLFFFLLCHAVSCRDCECCVGYCAVSWCLGSVLSWRTYQGKRDTLYHSSNEICQCRLHSGAACSAVALLITKQERRRDFEVGTRGYDEIQKWVEIFCEMLHVFVCN